ncbi:MAG: diguanylate cyclase [Caryophanon sp.]|nr:diguanylate cyclase [Caryophanon sp.]
MHTRYIMSVLFVMFLCVTPYCVEASPYIEELDEQWLFFNQQLITSIVKADAPQPTAVVDLPVEFEALTGQVSGYGTFVKQVKLDAKFVGAGLGLELPYTYSAAKVFINGMLYEEVGKVGTNAQTHERDLQSVVVPVKPRSETIEIAIQISSFNHIRGGFSGAPILGEWDPMYKSFVTERYESIFVGTIIFIVGTMTLIIGVIERKEKMFFMFGLFALVVAARALVSVPFLYHDVAPWLSYEWATRLEYFTTNLCFSLYALFIYLLYNKLFSKWILYPGVLLLWTLAILSLIADVVTFQEAFFNMFPAMIMFVVYNLWIMIRALKRQLVLARSLMLGVLFVFTGLIIDFLSGMGIIYSPPIANIMIALNVLLVMGSLCYNYVKNMRMVSKLNDELDEKVRRRTAELNKVNEELQRLVQFDGLTGVYNRHKFDGELVGQFAQATHISLCMIDIDEFKKYNDYYGHVQGDKLLKCMAQFVQAHLPKHAIFARYGGEEFAIILPNTLLSEAADIAEQVRAAIDHQRWEHLGRELGYVTISVGVAERMHDKCDDEVALLSLADARLYYSKRSGRNQVVTFHA